MRHNLLPNVLLVILEHLQINIGTHGRCKALSFAHEASVLCLFRAIDKMHFAQLGWMNPREYWDKHVVHPQCCEPQEKILLVTPKWRCEHMFGLVLSFNFRELKLSADSKF